MLGTFGIILGALTCGAVDSYRTSPPAVTRRIINNKAKYGIIINPNTGLDQHGNKHWLPTLPR